MKTLLSLWVELLKSLAKHPYGNLGTSSCNCGRQNAGFKCIYSRICHENGSWDRKINGIYRQGKFPFLIEVNHGKNYKKA